ncbi:fimbria/pilus periplasmic chaperone [Sphingopyxis sp. KK2]|uniref:fimbria/pilus periplasmic chaperone n=1 Tax=Sphingopyxis sp. KK2 TaxID=1855727 RepID=UPI00097E6604|nr:fimbria/pilus periplasmic chaperone [Sphingopyxis sp. KK2]
MFKVKKTVLAALAGVMGLGSVAAYAAMTVQPVILDLRMAGREMGGQIRVENTGTSPLPVEIRLVEADILPDTVKASDRLTDDLVAFPAQAMIAPGATQAFRIQYVGDPEVDRSRHYYAEVSQLPVEVPGGQSTIQVLYNFQAMVNVQSILGGEPKLTLESTEIVQAKPEDKPRIAFTVHNSGKNYGYLSSGSLTLVHRDASGKEVLRRSLNSSDVQQMIGFGLVGPEASRKFTAPIELESAGGTAEATLSGRSR